MPNVFVAFLAILIPLAVWVLLSLAVRDFFGRRGLNPATGFALSIPLSPLIGFLVGLVMTPSTSNVEARRLSSGEGRTCPYCAEVIKANAVVCRYCGRDIASAA